MTRRSRTTVAVLMCASAAALLPACAKRPDVAVVSAPAPVAPTPPPPAPVAPPPAPVARPAPAEFVSNDALRPVRFDFDKATIRKADVAVLEAAARWLTDNPGQIVLIEGHCDARGTTEYNVALGARRAQSAMTFLVGRGIAADRLKTVSVGEERPLCTTESDACWARNRRAMFLTRAKTP